MGWHLRRETLANGRPLFAKKALQIEGVLHFGAVPPSKLVNVRLDAAALAVLDTRAAERGLNRSEVLRELIAVGAKPPRAAELTEPELVAVLEAAALAGSVRACELLLKRLAKHADPEPVAPDASPFAEVTELASRRRDRA